MGDERLNELGLPRRAFLKRAIGTAFVAPVVVSFGLGGIAEAAPASFPNMCFGNQTLGDEILAGLVGAISLGQENGSIAPGGIAQSLLAKVMAAKTAFDGGDFATACSALADLQAELAAQSGKHIDAGTASGLADGVSQLQRDIGCDGCTRI